VRFADFSELPSDVYSMVIPLADASDDRNDKNNHDCKQHNVPG